MPQQTTFNALAEVPSLTTRSTPMHWLKRRQRGNIPGRRGSGRGRASHVEQRNSLRTNRTPSRLAPACRKARASSVRCGCPRLRCCRKSSRFSRSDKGRAVSVSSSSSSCLNQMSRLVNFFQIRRKYFVSVTSGSLRKMLSQHSILVTRQVRQLRFGMSGTNSSVTPD